jgi:hypothetical protein
MRIITPQPITEANLTSSNVPETDYPLWSAGTYTLGTRRIYAHKIYEVIVASTTSQPDVGAVAAPPQWLDLGATNRYKMFDSVISTQTSQTGTIVVTVLPAQITNAVAFFGLVGNTINVTVTDPVEGVVYNQTKSLQDNTFIVDWYLYYFEGFYQKEDAVFDDLPSYINASITVTVNAGAGTAKIGEMVMGRQQTLGVSNFGTSVSIQDYSVKTTDQFGNVVIVQRAFSKRADYDVTVETPLVSAVQKLLADIRTTPTVFIGDDDKPETVVYGFYKQFNIVISTPSISDCSIEVEGLV